MIDKIVIPGLRLGRCVAVPDVVYMSGLPDAVTEGLRRFEQEIGPLQILAEIQVGEERSVQIRYPEELSVQRQLPEP